MRHLRFLKIFVVLASACASMLAAAIDSNPQNPANWQRTQEFIGAEKHIINLTDGSTPESYLDVQDWANTSGPYPDAVISSVPLGCSGTRLVYAENQGLIRVRLKWIGVGSPPSTVDLNLYSFTRQVFGNVTDVESYISDGLGDSLNSYTMGSSTMYECYGTHLRTVEVVGDTATVEIEPINTINAQGTAGISSVQVETDWAVTFA